MFPISNPEIEIFEIIGGFVGNEALSVQSRLYKCLDEGKCCQIIDLKQVNQIDGLGIAIFENFLSRGLQIRLINVNPWVKSVIKMAKKEFLLQIVYNENDRTRAISLFEKEILERGSISGDGVLKKRHHVRVATSIPLEFTLQRNIGSVTASANIWNLSEDGALVGQIVVLNPNAGETTRWSGIIGQEVSNLKFKLNSGLSLVITQGKCVWGFVTGESLFAGIRFIIMSHHQRKMIRSFVTAHNNEACT